MKHIHASIHVSKVRVSRKHVFLIDPGYGVMLSWKRKKIAYAWIMSRFSFDTSRSRTILHVGVTLINRLNFFNKSFWTNDRV